MTPLSPRSRAPPPIRVAGATPPLDPPLRHGPRWAGRVGRAGEGSFLTPPHALHGGRYAHPSPNCPLAPYAPAGAGACFGSPRRHRAGERLQNTGRGGPLTPTNRAGMSGMPERQPLPGQYKLPAVLGAMPGLELTENHAGGRTTLTTSEQNGMQSTPAFSCSPTTLHITSHPNLAMRQKGFTTNWVSTTGMMVWLKKVEICHATHARHYSVRNGDEQ